MKKIPSPSIVIVGAGPVGLLLANLLGKRGIQVLIIDKRIGIKQWSRAIGIMPPSLEILKSLDLDKEFLELGLRIKELAIQSIQSGKPGRKGVIHIPFKRIPKPYPFILSLPQYKTQEILRESLKDKESVHYLQGTELLGYQIHDNGILLKLYDRITFQSLDVNTEYVVGCDGEKSQVRKLASIHADFENYPEQFMMGDFLDHSNLGKAAKLYFHPQGAIESFPLPGHIRRWIVQLPKIKMQTEDDLSFLIHRVKTTTGIELTEKQLKEKQNFEPKKMTVSNFFSNKVVLCGDAAHVMSPIGGQGMNTGFGDAWELAQRLVQVILKNKSHHEQFTLYETRRKLAVKRSTKLAEISMWIGTQRGWLKHWLRRVLIFWISRTPLSYHIIQNFAMLKIPRN